MVKVFPFWTAKFSEYRVSQLKLQFATTALASDEDRTTLIATEPGLGFSYNRDQQLPTIPGQMPIVVTAVNDGQCAHKRGVKIGWYIVSVNDNEMSDFKDFKEVQAYLLASNKALGKDPLSAHSETVAYGNPTDDHPKSESAVSSL